MAYKNKYSNNKRFGRSYYDNSSYSYGKDFDGGSFDSSKYKCINCGQDMIHFRSNGGYGLKCPDCGKAWFKKS